MQVSLEAGQKTMRGTNQIIKQYKLLTYMKRKIHSGGSDMFWQCRVVSMGAWTMWREAEEKTECENQEQLLCCVGYRGIK